MGLSEEIRQQLIDSFIVEQREHMQSITQGLLELEKRPAPAEGQPILQEIFRAAHSLKGAARAVGMNFIESLGHGLESALLLAKEGQIEFTPELFDLLHQTVDAVEMMVKQLEQGETTPPTQALALVAQLEQEVAGLQPATDEAGSALANETETVTSLSDSEAAAAPITSPAKNDETIRVAVSKLDALMAHFSELLAVKIQAEQRLAEIRQMQELADAWNKEWLAQRGSYSYLMQRQQNGQQKEVERLLAFSTKSQEYLKSFTSQCNLLSRQFANDNMRLKLIIDELQDEIKRMRMLPLSTITVTFGRMARDLARGQNKRVNLTVVGGDTELDKRVLELTKDPIIHLLRNAIDHGLEEPEIRLRQGKPAEGQIALTAGQQGNNVVISVSDDGRGLNLDQIRDAAIRKGILSPVEADQLNESEIALLIFNSGLSTSPIITDLSGRGVGLDVVRQNIEELQGVLDVVYEPGQGTTFTLTLPLTLASSRGLLVRAGRQLFALPLISVERMLHVVRRDISQVNGWETIRYDDKPVPLAWLEDLLELPTTDSREAYPLTAVIINVAEKRLGLIVNNLEGEQEIVMKSLGRQLVKVGGIAGATILGSGKTILALHPADLLKLAGRSPSRALSMAVNGRDARQKERKTILVVDDSITTRTLEKNILEAAGYRVDLATDGEEALARLAANGLPNLIISDINMPRLDGFGLTSRIKQDERFRDIPVILVTSLDSPADKARGIDAGADAYIVKSRFDQGNLLETIEQLIL